LEGDPLGGLRLAKECLIKRDEYIINLGVSKKIPVVMVLSGGYQKTNAKVIA
jgi:histone deacetylase 11